MIHHFTPLSRQQAKLIMNRIIGRPCAQPFIFPIDSIKSGYHDYYDKIQNPITLTQIMQKLRNSDAYSNFQLWRSDMLLVHRNAITYFGQDSLMGKLAQCFLEYFEKRYSSFSFLFDSSNWLKTYLRLNQKLKHLDSQMPGPLGTISKTVHKQKSIVQPIINLTHEPNTMKDEETQASLLEIPIKRKRGRPRLNTTKSSSFILSGPKPTFVTNLSNYSKSPDAPILGKTKFTLPIINRIDQSFQQTWCNQNEDDDTIFLEETDDYDKLIGSSF